MRSSVRKALLWQGVGLLFYLAGMLLFLFVGVGVFLAPPENSFANLSAAQLPYLLLSVVLLVVGRTVSWKFGGEAGTVAGSLGAFRDEGPEQSPLAQLGYRMPPEQSEEADREFAYEDGEVYVVCNECGTRNEQGFEYCSNCSAELPE